MKNINQKKQLIILSVLLLIIGVANYFNYYAPQKPFVQILSFSKLSEKEQLDLINSENKQISNQENEDVEISKEDIDYDVEIKDNYLTNAIDSNGKLVRWYQDKIIVYVASSNYTNVIFQALSEFNSIFEGYFKFYITNDVKKANVVINVVDHFSSNEVQDHIYMAGLTNNTLSGQSNNIIKSRVELLEYKPNSQKVVSQKEMYKVVLHELGHVVGIVGHSPNSSDIMYAFSGETGSELSTRDINTIKLMYSGNDKLIQRLTEDYADIRLAEAEKYAKRSPNKALAWINLAKVYFDQDRKTDAIESYKKAIALEPKNPLVYQSLAESYYRSTKYDVALKYYDLALSLSKSLDEKHNLYSMMGMCYAKKEQFSDAYIYFEKVVKYDIANKYALKNYLVACVALEKKQEAQTAINNYIQFTKSSIADDTFLVDTARWAGVKIKN